MSIIWRILRIAFGILSIIGAVVLVVFAFQTFLSPSEGGTSMAFVVMLVLTLSGISILLSLLGYAALKVLWEKKTEKVDKIEKPSIFDLSIDDTSTK